MAEAIQVNVLRISELDKTMAKTQAGASSVQAVQVLDKDMVEAHAGASTEKAVQVSDKPTVEALAGASTEKAVHNSDKPTVEALAGATPIDAPSAKPPSPIRRRKRSSSSAADSKLRSEAWDHFKKDKDDHDFAWCNYCGKKLRAATANGTRCLFNHLERCKKYPFQKKDKKQKTLPFVPESKGADSVPKFELAVARIELARMIVDMELPFRTVDHPAFHRFTKYLNPKFHCPSRITVAKDAFKLFLDEKATLKEVLSKASHRVSLTTDCWTSCQNLNYMCLTAHYIDDGLVLHKKILNFCQIPNHTGDVISSAIELCLISWGIKKVMTVTVDNASSNDLAIDFLRKRFALWNSSVLNGQFLQVRCCAHILNLIVREGLKELDSAIFRIRSAVKHMRSSPARLLCFKSVIDAEKIEEKSLLCMDVDTRWNSTFLMLKVALKFRRAFAMIEMKNKKYREELSKSKALPKEEDWDHAAALLPFLELFYDATKRISGSVYITCNIYMLEVCAIAMRIDEYCNDNDIRIRKMARNMREKYLKYIGNICSLNQLLFIAVILDPRHKLRYVEWLINTCYPEDVATELKAEVRDTLSNLFEEYKMPSSGSARAQPSKEKGDIHVSSTKSGLMHAADFLTMKFMSETGTQTEEKSELEKYLAETCEVYVTNFDILKWWRLNGGRFPCLSRMARDVLAIPISTVASESAFSTGGRVLDEFRNSLSPLMVEALICTKDWLRSPPSSIDLEEYLQEIEKMEGIMSSETPPAWIAVDD